MKIELNINPVPASRPRFGKGRTYNTDKYTEYKELLKYMFRKYDYFFKGATRIDIDFYIPMPESWTKKKKEEHNLKYHLQTPDKDNLEKAILDSASGIFFENDSIICDGRTTKRWSYKGKIVLNITEL